MTAPLRWLAVLLWLLAPAAARAGNPDALWHIVHDKCAAHLAAGGEPAPCAEIVYPRGEASGYVALKDMKGVAQFLLMPTAKITGIEDPAILAPDATNYWQAAWDARGYMLAALGRDLPRDALSLAINSPAGRTQNQLHIHIDCLRVDVRDALRRVADEIGTGWTDLTLLGHPYRVRRFDSPDLEGINPFQILAADPAVGPAGLREHTLVLVGADFSGGKSGFLLLDDRIGATLGDRASGEELQDHDCAVAR